MEKCIEYYNLIMALATDYKAQIEVGNTACIMMPLSARIFKIEIKYF